MFEIRFKFSFDTRHNCRDAYAIIRNNIFHPDVNKLEFKYEAVTPRFEYFNHLSADYKVCKAINLYSLNC